MFVFSFPNFQHFYSIQIFRRALRAGKKIYLHRMARTGIHCALNFERWYCSRFDTLCHRWRRRQFIILQTNLIKFYVPLKKKKKNCLHWNRASMTSRWDILQCCHSERRILKKITLFFEPATSCILWGGVGRAPNVK